MKSRDIKIDILVEAACAIVNKNLPLDQFSGWLLYYIIERRKLIK